MSMQSGLGQPAADARQAGIHRRYGGIGVLLLGLAVSACVSAGPIADLTETRRITIALELIDGPPTAVFHKFVKSLKDEAGARQIAVVPASEAKYRLRGYLATHGQGATSITWVLDVYDADQRRVFRLRGEEKAAGRAWAAADEQVLNRIARTAMQQFSVHAAARPGSTPVVPPLRRRCNEPRRCSAGSTIGPRRPPAYSAPSAASRRNPRSPPTRGHDCRPTRSRSRAAGRHRPAPRRGLHSPSRRKTGNQTIGSAETAGQKLRSPCRSYCQPRRLLVIRAPRARRKHPRILRLVAFSTENRSPIFRKMLQASRRETAMRPNNGAIKLVAGNSNPTLADAIAAYLATPLTKAVVRRFADMEIFVEIEENVRGSDVFVIQSTSFPANDHLMELLIIVDALRRASGRRVTAVIPYFGYARQDRKSGSRTPISAKLVANLITRAGADRVMTLDLHAGQIQGFFDIPTDNLYAAPLMVRDIKERFDIGKVMVVSPDVGGVGRARGLAKRINAPLAIVDKRRERPGEFEVMNVIGEVEGYTCILVDDIIDSGGTVVNAADALLGKGATEVYAYITHGVLSGGAVARISASRLKELVITDSIQPTQAVKVARNIRALSVATLIGEAIGRTATEELVSSLFD